MWKGAREDLWDGRVLEKGKGGGKGNCGREGEKNCRIEESMKKGRGREEKGWCGMDKVTKKGKKKNGDSR